MSFAIPDVQRNPSLAQTEVVDVVREVLKEFGLRVVRRRAVPGATEEGNANWHIWLPGGRRVVLRRYWRNPTEAQLRYEHRVLEAVSAGGWAVPIPVSDLLFKENRWWCLTEYVPGRARGEETIRQRVQRGQIMAKLDLLMRPLSEELGQRQGWQASHEGVSPVLDLEWPEGLAALKESEPRLAEWFVEASEATKAALSELGCRELPLTVVHGDLALQNIHYSGASLAGVVDFSLTHLDSRPDELAMARLYRAPEALDAYRQEMARSGWHLSELEEGAITPIYRAFRVAMAAWALHDGFRRGRFDTESIVAQLARSGVDFGGADDIR
jgi:Ser/Thr protein kinase RdoA (MazF antagonist)